MFTDIFKDIWRNKISRILLLSAISLIFIALILGAKINIYNFFYRIFVGEVFFDPYTYGRGEYGFEENPGKSEKLFKKGFKKLVEGAAEMYNMPSPEDLFVEDYNPEQSWDSFSSDKAIELVYMLFHDMELFCVPFDMENSTETDIAKNLEKRYSKRRDSNSDLLQYGIKDEEFMIYANWLLDLDQNYFYLALQKKPDSMPLLTLRKGLLKGVCKPQKIPLEMTRALDYREYKTERETYFQNIEELPDIIADNTREKLKKDRYYHRLLKDQFKETYFVTRNIAEKLKQSYNYYILQHNDYYLENYLDSLLDLSRISGVTQNKKIYDQLLTMKTEKLKNNSSFMYALAEISFRARQYDDTRSYLDELTLHKNLAGSDYYRIQRLYFLLELLVAG